MKVCEKYGWVILLAVGLLWLVVGIVAVFQPEGIFEGDAQSVTNMPWSELKTSSPDSRQLCYLRIRANGPTQDRLVHLCFSHYTNGLPEGRKVGLVLYVVRSCPLGKRCTLQHYLHW